MTGAEDLSVRKPKHSRSCRAQAPGPRHTASPSILAAGTGVRFCDLLLGGETAARGLASAATLSGIASAAAHSLDLATSAPRNSGNV